MIDLGSLASLASVWLALAFCGWLAWPLASRLLPDDQDRGYLVAKPLGWLIGAYCAWLAGVLGLPFAQFGVLTGLAGLCLVFVICLDRSVPLPPLPRILTWEFAFLLALLVGALIKARAPDIHGLEKFMDFGFFNAALRAQSMPPIDPWWAGQPINYYYFGHVAAAWVAQVAHVPADHGFNLMVATVFAFAAVLSYRLVAGCLRVGSRQIATVSGLMAAVLVTVGGNFHSVLYGALRPWSGSTLDRDFFYPDSTRFVGFDPDTGDKGFTEMPAYGFAVGDLHAHLINLPTGLLIALILARIVQRVWSGRPESGVRPLEAMVLGLLFAVCAMSNSWDAVSYAIMMALSGAALLLAPGYRRLQRSLGSIAAAGFAVVAALALASPFLFNFEPIASQIKISDGHTPLWQLAVIYGHVLAPFAAILVGLVLARRQRPEWIGAAVLGATVVMLVALPEIAYVKDIYGDDHRRANTMFKFAFQAQPLAAITGSLVVGLLLQNRRFVVAIIGMVLAGPMLATLSYAHALYGDTLGALSLRTFTLDGLDFIDKERPDDRALIEWLRAQPPDGRSLLVEAPGDSFTDGSALSAMSGFPSLVGWRGHETLWRGQDTPVYQRADEVAAFYGATDLNQACAFVERYGVTHVALGTFEHKTWPDRSFAVLQSLGTVAVRSGNAMIITVDPILCDSSIASSSGE